LLVDELPVRAADWRSFQFGTSFLLFGLAKKVILADNLAVLFLRYALALAGFVALPPILLRVSAGGRCPGAYLRTRCLAIAGPDLRR
jgi:hypothetical protein